MNEISIMQIAYDECIEYLAKSITKDNFTNVQTYLNDYADEVCDEDSLTKFVENYINDLPYDEQINLITASPLYFKKQENKRGAFIPDDCINELRSCDIDNVIAAIDYVKEIFVFEHEDVIKQIISEIKTKMPEIVKKLWNESHPAHPGKEEALC